MPDKDQPREYVEPVFVASVAREGSVGSRLRIERQNPDGCVLALELLAEGAGVDEISEKTGLKSWAIASLRARHDVPLEVRRKQLAADGFEMAENLRLLAKKKMQQLFDDPEALKKVSIKDLVLSRAIEQDKSFQALGEQKTIIEHRTGKPSLADAQKAIEDARKSLQKEAIPVEAEQVK